MEMQNLDFLIGKTEIELMSSAEVTSQEQDDAAPETSSHTTYQEAAKLRAKTYQKEQYQKQKLKLKENKANSKSKISLNAHHSFSPETEAALEYFKQNGYPMPSGPSVEIVAEAKKKLSRFFHPDRGGSNEESAELNAHADVLMRFLA